MRFLLTRWSNNSWRIDFIFVWCVREEVCFTWDYSTVSWWNKCISRHDSGCKNEINKSLHYGFHLVSQTEVLRVYVCVDEELFCVWSGNPECRGIRANRRRTKKQEDRRQKITRHSTASLTVMEIVIILFYYLGARLLCEQWLPTTYLVPMFYIQYSS